MERRHKKQGQILRNKRGKKGKQNTGELLRERRKKRKLKKAKCIQDPLSILGIF